MVVCYNCYLLSQVKVHTQFYLVLISNCLSFQCAFFPPAVMESYLHFSMLFQ